MKVSLKKGIAVGAIVLTAGLSAAACGSIGGSSSAGNAANQRESQAQGQDSYNLTTNQPVPVYKFSQMRATEIDIQDIQANGEDTTSFFFNQGVQNPVMSCTSRGMPVPASAELTNPDQTQWNSGGNNAIASAVTGQMDPTGVYTGDTTGTNVLCIDLEGREYIDYWEGFVQTVSGPATWNLKTHTIVLLGSPDTLRASGAIKSQVGNKAAK